MTTSEVIIAMYQNTKTALQSISDLKPKTDNKEFLNLLETQEKRYKHINEEIEDLAKTHKVELKDNNWFEKARLWTSIQMSTVTNNTVRKLAEMMLIGTVMGTLELYKNKYDYKNPKEDVKSLILKLEQLEEDHFDELKKYLKG
ncbi:MAG: hypothetical protein IJW24_03995 [Clostridia bacterium]|nr:hypothetical protein [Clostridia bacterium]